MKTSKIHQKLPTVWEEREKLRERGQFWTPDWIAEAMVEYVIQGSKMLFDPAAGKGAFFDALKKIRDEKKIRYYGIDIDEDILLAGLKEKIFNPHVCRLERRDFISSPPKRKFKSIVANPPYIRHHRLSQERKSQLQQISKSILGFTIDARAGLHVFFLLQALNCLQRDGKLAFIMPADVCEGIFADKLWRGLTAKFCLEAIVTFSPEATPFPGVDVSAVVLLIRNGKQSASFYWVKARKAYSLDLRYFIASGFRKKKFSALDVKRRNINDALRFGLTRPLLEQMPKYRLIDFAKVMRGIATGANDYFLMTKEKATKLKIPKEFLFPAIARTRDIRGLKITQKTLHDLEAAGRPTLLFAPDGRKMEDFPRAVRNYLLYGESLGLHYKSLISTRSPWYKMERREPPTFLFAYLGRRNIRFIRNDAKVLPLTGFLCVYLNSKDKDFINRMWQVLNHPRTIENLSLVGKSYGAGAIKVEPRALEKLPLLEDLIIEYNLADDTNRIHHGTQLYLTH